MFKGSYPILAVSGFARTVNQHDTTLHDLLGNQIDADSLFFEVFQNKVRRASRYVKFSNLAALQCLKQIDPTRLKGKNVGLFLGTGLGNTPDTVKFTSEVLHHYDTVVSPSTFINTVSNAGLFYAARALEMDCTTNVISQETVSFEAALLSAVAMLQTGELDYALVGGADVIEPPYETSKLRIHSKNITAGSLGEGAAYMLLAKDELNSQKNIGYLHSVEVGISKTPLMSDLSAVNSCYSFGLDQSEPKYDPNYFCYRDLCGDYPTGAAFGLCRFLVSDNSKKELLHLNQHNEGVFARVRISRA